MPRWMRKGRLVYAFAAGLITVSFVGCGKQDLSEYHRAKELSNTTVSETKSEAEPAETAPSEPASTSTSTSTSTPAADHPESNVAPVVQSPPAGDVDSSPVSALVPVNVVDGGSVRGLIGATDESRTESTTGRPKEANPAKIGEAPSGPRKIEVLIKEKSFRHEPKTGALQVSFDDFDLLKVLNMEPVVANAKDLMPDWLTGLEGKKVRVRGYMYPTFDTEGIEHFVLARDNQICCFGRDPKIYDLVQVDMKAGKTTYYIPATRAFDVVGTFQIRPQSEDGKLYGLYVIEDAEVIVK